MTESELLKSFNRKQKFMIFSVVTFLCTLIAATYAWIAHDFLGISNTMSMTSIAISIEFVDESVISFADMAPGESISSTFKVINNTDTESIVNFQLEDVINNLENRNYFVYYIVNQTTGKVILTPRYLPKNDIAASSNIIIPANTEYTYSLVATYINDPQNTQQNNQNLYFQGKISMSGEEVVANSQDDITRRTMAFVNGINVSALPAVGQYTVDTTRTYCTDGSTISIENGNWSIKDLVDSTNCELYVITNGTIPEIKSNNEKYNLLVVNYNNGLNFDNLLYLRENETFTLTPVVLSGYMFIDWDIVSNDSSLNDNTVTMGTSYTYVEAYLVEGYYNKTTLTCAEGAASSYIRTYKTCDRSFTDYKMTEKTCLSKRETTAHYNHYRCNCVCVRHNTELDCTLYNCSWANTSNPIVFGTCGGTSSGNCSSGQINYDGNSRVTCSETTSTKYYFGTPRVTDHTDTCTENLVTCASNHLTETNIECENNYNYYLGSTINSDVSNTCLLSSFSCSEEHYNDQTFYVTSCTGNTFDYGFVPSTSESLDCQVQEQPICNSSNEGVSYVYSCDFVLTSGTS